ncbi:50S ribosomal protein L30 [Candidatus Woesearchaeota archaeon]|nr:50S ribosomal protein L30 [Candidatus Woesearchaeota archaeon]
METKQLAAIRIKGMVNTNRRIEDTLSMLRLYRRNYCAVAPDTHIIVGMLKKAKDCITWGEIDNDTFKMLVEKRGEEFKGTEKDSKNKIEYNDFAVIDNKKIKKYFRLNSPKKGFGRKGLKHTFKEGGALGYRGSAINDLIKRMI